MTNLTWERLSNGDRIAKGQPIRLTNQGTVAGRVWVVQVPIERDEDLLGGWAWGDVYLPDSGLPGKLVAGSNFNEARATVADHFEEILAYAAAHQSGYGEPEPDLDDIEPPQFTEEEPTERVTVASEQVAAPDPYDKLNLCACGCGEGVSSIRVYRAGHDARHRDKLVDLLIRSKAPAVRARRIEALIVGLGGRD
jgi:hypothetical protein